jgi:hypothetical protein
LKEIPVASKTVRIYTSDLTGKDIKNTDELVEVRVLDHPSINRPVTLDAYALEVQSLLDAGDQFVTLEVVLPGQAPRRVVVPGDVFDKVFESDVDETLANAEPYYPSAAQPAHRTGRAPAPKREPSSSDSGSREQRAAIRDWANSNGYTVGDRGRIKAEIIEAFEAAHN